MNEFGGVESDLEDKFSIESNGTSDGSNGEGRGANGGGTFDGSEISVFSKRICEEEKTYGGREGLSLLFFII